MPDQIFIGNTSKGQTTNRTAFNIDNDAFPMLYNFFTWRGRLKRKRGTRTLGQLQIQQQIATVPNNWQLAEFTLVSGSINLISHYNLGATSSIVPGSISLIGSSDGTTYTDPSMDGTLLATGGTGTAGTINYSSGVITIVSGSTEMMTGLFSYYPGLPVMGIEDYLSSNPLIPYPLNIFFDTRKAYMFNGSNMYNVSFYKNTNNAVTWSGEDYQQFWSTNYQSAFWATNNVPGFNFKLLTPVSSVTVTQITATTVTINLNANGLILGDLIWINEVTGTIATGSGTTQNQNINGQTGRITTIGANSFVATFDGAGGTSLANFQAGATGNLGIAQYLTQSITGQDGIKWFDGDPTSSDGIPPASPNGFGWVNFSPPLTAAIVNINSYPEAKYYLVGALIIQPFKDRLLFFGCWIQASSGPAIYLQDTAIWSWNGTAYYSALTPRNTQAGVNETSDPTAYYVDQTGKGGFLSAGVDTDITTLTNNEDVLLIGFTNRQTRFVYTGNDINPFLFFNINSELGSAATFSGITLDQGGISIGSYGIVFTDQQSSQRIDLDIPDSVFSIQAQNNGMQRVNAVRDYFNEWCYFAYPVDAQTTVPVIWKFPTQTFFYNYRDKTWAILYENFTAYGTYRAVLSAFTWITCPYPTWDDWQVPWGSSQNTADFPAIAAGNPQGFIIIKDDGVAESPTGTIQNITDVGGLTQITSLNSCVNIGDYLYFSGALGILTSTITGITRSNPIVITTTNTFNANSFVTVNNVMGMSQLNGNTYLILSVTGSTITIDGDSTSFTPYISGGSVQSAFNGIVGQVKSISDDTTSFVVDILYPQNTYIGLGQYTRLSQPILQTKQFNVYWEQGKKIRLGKQQYLFDYTPSGQVTINIQLSQDSGDVWNNPMTISAQNADQLIYSQLVYTCPESTNLGLTPSNVTLQNLLPNDPKQSQIWHRINTSLIGDTVQIGITLSDTQMRDPVIAQSDIVLHAIIMTISPSALLS